MAREKKSVSLTFRHQTLWVISTAFSIAAALFWKDTITQLFNAYIPASQNLLYSLYASVIVTVIAILAVVVADKLLRD